MLEILDIDEKILKIAEESEKELSETFEKIDKVALINTAKIMKAFKNNKISEVHFNGSTGYGYDDIGRETIEKVYSDVFDTEDALVRIQFVNGTHALSVALRANLKGGDILLSITGDPYDTLGETIGIVENPLSLINQGIKYSKIDIKDDEIDIAKVEEYIGKNKVTMIFIGRSRGYTTRKSLSVDKIKDLIARIKNIDNNIIVMVDNCYGELVEEKEPTSFGADIMAGSLIKNIGGGLCETGGYIVGKKDLVERSAEILTAPGIGKECGATLGKNREILQGLFISPQTVKNAKKIAILTAKMAEKLGYETSPKSTEERADIIQSIIFKDEKKLISFICGIQEASPVDSFVTPTPWNMPGYIDKVIMAAGTFISGASIELSADAPIKPPYVAYLQGGLTYESAKLAICKAFGNI